MSEEETISLEEEPSEGEATTASDLPSLGPQDRENIERFNDIVVTIDAVLGRVVMPIEQFLKLGRGAIIELDQGRDDNLELVVNGITLAMGEITVLDDSIGVNVQDVAHKNKMYRFDMPGEESTTDEEAPEKPEETAE